MHRPSRPVKGNNVKSLLRILLLAAGLLLVFSGCSSDSIQVSGAWARTATVGQNTAVYFELKNSTSADDTLIGVDGEIAKKVETHETTVDANNVASMKHMPSISVPADSTIAFEPGGLHVMMMSLDTDLNPGDSVTITLHFENNADLVIIAEVREP